MLTTIFIATTGIATLYFVIGFVLTLIEGWNRVTVVKEAIETVEDMPEILEPLILMPDRYMEEGMPDNLDITVPSQDCTLAELRAFCEERGIQTRIQVNGKRRRLSREECIAALNELPQM